MIKQWEINYDNNKVSMDCKIIAIDAKNNACVMLTTTSNDSNNTSLQRKSSVIIGDWDETSDIKLFSHNEKNL